MSAALLMTGRRPNLLARARVVTVSSQDTKYPVENIYNNDPATPFRFGSAGTDVVITGDLAAYTNGDFEIFSAGQFTGWSVFGPGAVAQTASGQGGSTSALSIQRGATLTYEYRDVSVRAGEEWRLDGWGRRGAVGTATATIRIQNRATGKYLTSGGAWQVAVADLYTNATTTYTNALLTFIVESAALCQADEVPLRLELMAIGGGASTDTAFFDNVWMWPTWDYVSAHGHNIPPGFIVPEIHSSTDNFSGSDTTEAPTYPSATITALQPTFWARLSARNIRRYCRLKLVGTPDTIIYIGELAFAQAAAMSQCFGYPIEKSRTPNAHYEETGGGNAYSYLVSSQDPRTYVLDYQANTLAAYEEAETAVARARGRHYPLLFVPNDSESVVLHGRFDETFTSKRIQGTVTTYPQRIKESAFPGAIL